MFLRVYTFLGNETGWCLSGRTLYNKDSTNPERVLRKVLEKYQTLVEVGFQDEMNHYSVFTS